MSKSSIIINIITIFLLFISTVLMSLKAIGKINWSWIWVLSPIWIPTVLVFVLGVAYIVYVIKVMEKK